MNNMNEKQFEELLSEEIGNLKREINPARDLWPGIDHAINTNTITLSKPAALAAGIVFAVSLVLSGSLYFGQSQPDIRAINELITLLQSEHEKNKQALLVEYQNQSALAPDWESQMNQLEQAELAIYEALRGDPDNIELLKILRQVQTKQIELIESVYAPLFTTI